MVVDFDAFSEWMSWPLLTAQKPYQCEIKTTNGDCNE
jgi:hypothetical protein